MSTPTSIRTVRRAGVWSLGVALLLAATLVAAPAPAGPPGRWTPVAVTNSILSAPGTVRTADGVLHVFDARDDGTTWTLLHTAISPAGRTLGQSVVVSGWAALTEDPVPVLTADGGLRVIFGGLADTDVANPLSSGRLISAVSDAAGAVWSIEALRAGETTTGYASYGTGATSLADGTPVTAYP